MWDPFPIADSRLANCYYSRSASSLPVLQSGRFQIWFIPCRDSFVTLSLSEYRTFLIPELFFNGVGTGHYFLRFLEFLLEAQPWNGDLSFLLANGPKPVRTCLVSPCALSYQWLQTACSHDAWDAGYTKVQLVRVLGISRYSPFRLIGEGGKLIVLH